MSDLLTLPNTTSVIFSPVSVSGHAHCATQAYPTMRTSGQARALASLSARQVKEMGLMTSGTFGPRSNTLSKSAALQSSLVNRLQARTSTLGSTLYKLTWKEWVLPSGRSLSRLRASVPRTSATERTGWPTPTTRDHKDGPECQNVPINALLGRAAWLAGWSTPQARDYKGAPGKAATESGSFGASLPRDAQLAAWATPTTLHNHRSEAFAAGRTPYPPEVLPTNQPARLTVSGQMLTGSSAGTTNGGQLNPAHSRWLMGLPRAWDDCAPTETQSFYRKRQSLSAPASKLST